MYQETHDRIAEQLVEVFERYKALDERRAALAPEGRQQERAQVEKAIKSVIGDFVETSYPLARNSARRWWNFVEPEDLAHDVIAKLLRNAEQILQYRTDTPIALVHTCINNAINTALDTKRRKDTREEKVVEILGGRMYDNVNASTDEAVFAAFANLDREERIANLKTELALIENDLVRGQEVCVFHPSADKYHLDHQLVAEVLRETPLAVDPANSDEFEQYVEELHTAIKCRFPVKNSKTLSDRHYRCLDWFLYRLYRTTDSSYHCYAAERLAGHVKLLGDRSEAMAAWNRQSCPKGVAKMLWRECPKVKARIAKYLEDKRAAGHITDTDVRRLIAELER